MVLLPSWMKCLESNILVETCMDAHNSLLSGATIYCLDSLSCLAQSVAQHCCLASSCLLYRMLLKSVFCMKKA